MNSARTSQVLLTLIMLIIPGSLWGQEGVSSMSMGVGRAGVSSVGPNGRYVMPSPDLIRIEEFVNYHRHRIPLPKGKDRVQLSLQQTQLNSGRSVLQVGLATPHSLDPELVAPMNLVLVIDRSGSMAGDRIANVKKAILALVERLRKQDRVTIVGFSGEARVHLAASDKTKMRKIERAVQEIDAVGGTNLNAGLMLGYQQALENYDELRTNRVILLTDGVANVGQTDLEVIAKNSKSYNQRGIDLSTIGLGDNLNHNLLRELADAGKGLIHFVADETDIQKTFVSEVESLLAPAARKVKLVLDFGTAAESVKVYGYSPKRKGSKYVFALDDLNHGATQVVMVKTPKEMPVNVDATLRYADAISGEQVEETQSVTIKASIDSNYNVKRNYAIALIGESIKRACIASNDGECAAAEKRLAKGLKSVGRLVDHREDQHVNRMVEIADDYLAKVRQSIARRQRD